MQNNAGFIRNTKKKRLFLGYNLSVQVVRSRFPGCVKLRICGVEKKDQRQTFSVAKQQMQNQIAL